MSKIQHIEEVLYWLEHTTMSREDIIKIFRDQLEDLQTEYENK
jgi:hypothetical protein